MPVPERPEVIYYVILRRWQARPPFFAVRQLGQLALIGILFPQITSRLSEYSPEYPHLIFRIPGRIKIVSRDFLIPTSKLAIIVIRNNYKNPKMAIFKSRKIHVEIKLET